MSTGNRIDVMSHPKNIQSGNTWRKVLLGLGHFRSVLAITLFSILLSAVITFGIMTLLWWEGLDVLLKSLLVAVIVPAVVAPLASSFVVQLLFELEDLQKQLLEMVNCDPLTKVHSRRYIVDCLEIESMRALRSNEPLSLLMIDADNFKSINDCYGHATGDIVLQEIAHTCKSTLRPYDVIARFGGEEFVVLLPNTTLLEACDVAERIRENVAGATIKSTDGAMISVTISIGISLFTPPDLRCMNLLSNADRGLYEAKHNGRNQCAIALDSKQ
jgi:diguanylate cyclase (GGDEF)-like protein